MGLRTIFGWSETKYPKRGVCASKNREALDTVKKARSEVNQSAQDIRSALERLNKSMNKETA